MKNIIDKGNLVTLAVDGMKNSYCCKVSAGDIQIVKVMNHSFTFTIDGKVNRHNEPLLFVCGHDGYKPYAELIF